jgi:acyl carrier protein
MEQKVRAIIEEHSGLGEVIQGITSHDDLWLMGMTSLASVQVMLALESTFGFEFPESKLLHVTFSSISRIMDCVKELTGSGA